MPSRCCEVMTSTGTPSCSAVSTPGRRLADPGPGGPTTAATLPVVLYSPSAMCTAAASCRTGTCRMPCDSSSTSNGSTSGEGRPKRNSMPSACSPRANSSPPVISVIDVSCPSGCGDVSTAWPAERRSPLCSLTDYEAGVDDAACLEYDAGVPSPPASNGRDPRVLAIDAGGTMTDTFIVDRSGDFVVGKAQTTPEDEAVGLMVTGGMEDALRLERGIQTYLGYPYSDRLHVATHYHNEPLVPRELVKGVRERIDLFGEPAIPLYEDEARQAVQELVDAGVEGIVVNFLYSYRNSAHEDRVS